MICTKCDTDKPVTEFYARHDRRGQFHSCCKKCTYGYQKRNREDKKATLVAERGGGCEICGYDRCHRALSFHHRDPAKKSFKLGAANLNRYSLDEIRAEADKCDLLCANCHMELHSGLAQ